MKGGCENECDIEKILIPRPLPNKDNEKPSASPPAGGRSVSQEQIEKEANDRMLQPPPLAPTPEEEGDDPAVERIRTGDDGLPDYSDGYGMFLLNELTDFIG